MSIITVNRAELKQALAIVKRTVGGPRPMPILGNVLIESDEWGARVSTTDLELSSVVKIKADDCHPPVKLCVPLKALAAVVRASKGETVSIEGLEGFKVKVGGATLAGNDPGEYPTLPTDDDHEQAESFDASTLGNALQEVSYAASRDETRYNLNGVLFESNGAEVLLTATDGHRLAQSRIGAHVLAGCGVGKEGWIVPLGFVTVLEALVGKRKPHAAYVRIGSLGLGLSAVVGNVTLVCRLIDGEYPNYQQVIPERNGRVAHFDRVEFLDRLEDVWGCLSERNHAIRVTLNGVIELEASNPDVGDASSSVSADISEQASGAALCMNARYLKSMLEASPADRMGLYLQAPEVTPADGKIPEKARWDCSPLVFAPSDSPSVAVIMPMRV